MKVKVKRFSKEIPLPKYEKGAAGFDFFCCEIQVLNRGKSKLFVRISL